MKFPSLVPGRFLARENRFRALVNIDGRPEAVHVPNSGRLLDLFIPDRPVWLAPVDKPGRKTRFDLKLVEHDGDLVCVDARLPNPIFAEGLAAGQIANLPFPEIKPEVKYGASRLDFRLSGAAGVCWVETKSVTLVAGGVALFPDAPTARGRRHLESLQQARATGDQALVVFIVQRADADFVPHAVVDPDLAEALRVSQEGGVSVRAFTCQVARAQISLDREIPVHLNQTS